MYNILICDDERDILNALCIYLTQADRNLITAQNGRQAIELARRNDLHLIILDIMMPELDGITAMREIRSFSNTPIILLTAKSEEEDMISGLDSGADDYVTKPFSKTELLARVNAQIRRFTRLGGSSEACGSLCSGDIELNDTEKSVSVSGEYVTLTPTEFDILKLLMQNPGKVFSPREIYSLVWNDPPYGSENTVAVHIRHLREKIEINPASPRHVKVVWGQGYKFQA